MQGVVEGPCGGRSLPSEGARVCHLIGPLRTLSVPELSFALVPWASPLPSRTHMACASGSKLCQPLLPLATTRQMRMASSIGAPLRSTSCLDSMHPYAHPPSKHQTICNTSPTAISPNRPTHIPAANVIYASVLVSPPRRAWVTLAQGSERDVDQQTQPTTSRLLEYAPLGMLICLALTHLFPLPPSPLLPPPLLPLPPHLLTLYPFPPVLPSSFPFRLSFPTLFIIPFHTIMRSYSERMCVLEVAIFAKSRWRRVDGRSNLNRL